VTAPGASRLLGLLRRLAVNPAAPAALRLALALTGLAMAATWRWPYQVDLRPWLFALSPAAALLAVLEARRLRAQPSRPARLSAWVTFLAAALAVVGATGAETRFRWVEHRVLSAEPARLARLGRHLVVGYRDAAALEALLRRRAVGGVFVTWWNAQGRGTADIAGPIITDDFSMMALFRSSPGVGQGAVDALAAGVDLVLVSYDSDQYYVAMDALLEADRGGRLDPAVLAQSEARLDAAWAALALAASNRPR
jgi:hypothetical protein